MEKCEFGIQEGDQNQGNQFRDHRSSLYEKEHGCGEPDVHRRVELELGVQPGY